MVRLTSQQVEEFRFAVHQARQRETLRASVANVYVALQDAIELQKPVCERSGRCCRFEEYGHRLFVTTLEMAAFMQELAETPVPNPGGCPFQKGGLCSVHTIRPLGCRLFFCDPTATQWQQDQYQRFHTELRRLHDEAGIPYFYVEWREALEYLNLGGREV